MIRFKKWLMTTWIYHYLLKHVIPYIRISTYYTTMRGKTYHQVYSVIQPGDIILSVDNKKLTTFLIGGEFSHAAVCVSKDKQWEVSEMTHTDYTKSCVSDLCYEATRVVVLRPTSFSPEYKKAFIEKTKSFDGVPYDNMFELGVEALSCSELVYEADFERKLELNLEDVLGLGELYISPTGISKSERLTVVIDTDNFI